MGAAYPKLAAQQEQRITDVLKGRRALFETLENGMEILDAALAGGAKVLPGEVAFKLHDTFGFPLDLSADVCRERDVTVDEAGFHAAMEQAKGRGPRRRQVQDGPGAGLQRRRQPFVRLRHLRNCKRS
jgi:alanyl-tRNA synthetase